MAHSGENKPKEKVWTTLITNSQYLPGLLTLEYSLRRVNSAYPLVVLYTDTFPQSGLQALAKRGIRSILVEYLLPSTPVDFSRDPRFYDCWTKLTPFSLTQFDRIIQLDSDMLILQNMDELMELELDRITDDKIDSLFDSDQHDRSTSSLTLNRLFAASHACVCNPMNFKHYPADWIAKNCAYTLQPTSTPNGAESPPCTAGLGIPNGGLQVVNPSEFLYKRILRALSSNLSAETLAFADQSLLGHIFKGRWVALPYTYNALKTMRNIHREIWRDEDVKNIHYILTPKPWEESQTTQNVQSSDATHAWWWDITRERLQAEHDLGIHDDITES